MQVIGLIGYVDKYDFAMNLAKAINVMDKSVLVVDATLDRKLKYIVPALSNMGRAYITQYSDIDFAVGFDSIRDVESYASEQGIDINKYDFVIIDMDSARSYELFRTKGIDKKYFFIDTSVLSIEKNKEIIKAMKVFDAEGGSELAMTKVLYPSVSASLRSAPFFASVMAMMRCLASSFPTCASSCSFNNRKAMAGSVVVPDFEMTTMPKDLFFRRVCSSNK